MSSSRIQSQSSDVPVETFVSDQDVSSPKRATKRSRYKCQVCRRKRIKVSGPTALVATSNGASVLRLLTARSAYPNFATGELEKTKSVTHVRGMAKFVVRIPLRRPARPSSTSDTSPLGPTQLHRWRARLGSFRTMWSSQLRL
jgi:transposase-like protein